MSKPTPDELMAAFQDAAQGLSDLSPADVVHDIIEDILDSVLLACETYEDTTSDEPKGTVVDEIYHCVSDYVTNHYGEL